MVRFTIRDLLWLTVVVAMGAAWSFERSLTRYDYDNFVRKHANFKWIDGDELGRPLVSPDGEIPRQLPLLSVGALMAMSSAIGVAVGAVSTWRFKRDSPPRESPKSVASSH